MIFRFTSFIVILFLILSVLEVFGVVYLNYYQKDFSFFVVATLGFNSAHVGLTGTLFFLPEYSEFKHKLLTKHHWMKWIVFGLFIVLFSAVISYPHLERCAYLPEGGAAMIYQSILVFHALMQTKGLLYVHSDYEFHKIEKNIINLSFFTLIFLNSTYLLYEFMLDNKPIFWEKMIICLSQIPVILLICVLFLYKNREKSRFFFVIRLLMWPLSIYSIFAFLGTLVLHGYEYLDVSGKMISRSQLSQKQKYRTIISATFFVCILSVMAMGLPSSKAYWFSPPHSVSLSFILSGLYFFLILTTIVHIFLDSTLFKFTNQPLLSAARQLIYSKERQCGDVQ